MVMSPINLYFRADFDCALLLSVLHCYVIFYKITLNFMGMTESKKETNVNSLYYTINNTFTVAS
jgi:hypothetical protein